MQRDTTKALAFVVLAINTTDNAKKNEYLGYAKTTLQDIDARTTSKDPSKKPKRKRASKTATPGSAAKAGARRR